MGRDDDVAVDVGVRATDPLGVLVAVEESVLTAVVVTVAVAVGEPVKVVLPVVV